MSAEPWKLLLSTTPATDVESPRYRRTREVWGELTLKVSPKGLVRIDPSVHFRSVTCFHEGIAKSRDLLGLPLLICKVRLMLVSTSKGCCEHQMGQCLLGAEHRA